MNLKHFSKLEEGKANITVPPMIEVHMTGVQMAKQNNTGLIRLIYTDCTEESRESTKDLATEFDSFFAVVSFVQEGREETSND